MRKSFVNPLPIDSSIWKKTRKVRPFHSDPPKMNLRRMVFLPASLILMSCSDTTDLERWSSMRRGNAATGAVEVRVSTIPNRPGSSPPVVTTLSDRGQAALVEALARIPRDRSGFLNDVIGRSPASVPARTGQPLSDRAERTLVVTLSRPLGGDENFQPGDRIIRAVVNVRPLNFTMAGYSAIRTDRQSAEVATVTRDSQISGNASLSAGPAAAAAVPVGGSAGLEASRRLQTQATLREWPEVLTVEPIPGCLRMTRESPRGSDLTGNAFVNLSIIAERPPTPANAPNRAGRGADMPCGQTTTATRSPRSAMLFVLWVVGPDLQFRDGAPVVAGSARVGALQTHVNEPLQAEVTLDYVLRRIVSGGQHYSEGRHSVELQSGHETLCQTVVQGEDVLPTLYVIGQDGRDDASDDDREGRLVRVETAPGDGRTALSFTDFQTARSVARWINRTRPARFGSMRLHLPYSGQYAARRFTGRRYGPCGGETESRQAPA